MCHSNKPQRYISVNRSTTEKKVCLNFKHTPHNNSQGEQKVKRKVNIIIVLIWSKQSRDHLLKWPQSCHHKNRTNSTEFYWLNECFDLLKKQTAMNYNCSRGFRTYTYRERERESIARRLVYVSNENHTQLKTYELTHKPILLMVCFMLNFHIHFHSV